MTWLRRLLCGINGHPSRETIYGIEHRPSGITLATAQRQTCLKCGKVLT